MDGEWPRDSQPATVEIGAPQSIDDPTAAPCQLPDKTAAMVLHHQDYGSLVQTQMERRHPSFGGTSRARISGIESGLEAVAVAVVQLQGVDEMVDGFQHDVRCEWQRGYHRPRREC